MFGEAWSPMSVPDLAPDDDDDDVLVGNKTNHCQARTRLKANLLIIPIVDSTSESHGKCLLQLAKRLSYAHRRCGEGGKQNDKNLRDEKLLPPRTYCVCHPIMQSKIRIYVPSSNVFRKRVTWRATGNEVWRGTLGHLLS